MKSTRKCPNCGQWSVWDREPTSRCQYCQHLLDPDAHARQLAKAERSAQNEERFAVKFIKIDPQDSFGLNFIKRIGLGFQVAFVSIVSFILWLVALLAG